VAENGTVDEDKALTERTQRSKEHYTMKTSMNISRFLAVSAIALAVPLSAMAYDRGSDRGDRGDKRPVMEARHHRGMPDLRGIDLSADQVAQLSKLRDEQRKTFAEKGLALREQHIALKKLAMSDDYTSAAADQIIGKISAAQAEMAKMHAEQGNKLYKILTPEQRTKLQQNELFGRGSMGHGFMR
jgi:Spy/CpxP family protein refolding chaperone